ncbi:restriction endonuclease subunit S [Pseudomonas fluorescens]|uniref:restriction endonuclease subunit S n=1 Tax=Pseudomonas fluorescens TaxID=294 RepID=UPI0005C5BBBC|nr:restriction endonuclease subunit S [Pseudomonas fluorescens]
MTALLTDNLPLLAGTPNGIKKLRELILKLAVRGKLVPQDPSDEPANELLKRVDEDTTRSVAGGRRRKQSTLPSIDESEKAFELPNGWEWVRLQQIISVSSGDGLVSANMKPIGGIPVYGGNGINGYHDKKNVSKETLVIGRVGYYCGSIHLTPANAWVTDNALIVSFSENNFYKNFLFWLLKGTNLKEQENATAQPVISGRKIYPIVLAIPPFAEQHRIVAKVDELMALCDSMEAQQADAESAHAQLVQALLDSLTQARDAYDFFDNWQRLAEHFHTLFTTEPSIDALKQALLQLAVMGKLVAQDRSDEPASELLKRIADDKEQLVSKGMIRKQKPVGEITEDKKPYELPAAWTWTRLGSQVLESGAGWSPNCEARPKDGDEWGILKVSAVSWGIYRPEENKALPPNLEARPEHEVAKGDFLVSRANTSELVARSVVVENTPKHLMLSDKIVRLRLTPMCASRYINLANSAPFARCYYSEVAGGTSSSMKNVSREQILNLPIALPPLAEQYRIVEKFDSLMAICEKLKSLINAATEKQIALLNAFVAKI